MVAVNLTAQKMRREIVTLRGTEPFTTSLAIAEGVGLPHASVIKLIRKHREMFAELGFSGFQIQKKRGTQGRETEYAELNEDAATFLMTLFRNSDVVLGFKLRLVKAFRRALNEFARMRRQQAEPAWQLVRDETRVGFKWMTESLTEARAAAGKATGTRHFQNEARMLNAVLTGKFAALNRDELSSDELALLAELQRRDALLLARGLPYAERKAALRAYLGERRPLLGDAA